MKLFIYILCIAFTLISCGKNSCKYAIIGGEIINKNTDYVVLFDSKDVIDTLKLDGNNRFSYQIDNLTPGFYTFRHGGEIQMVLLEPGDSIMFRLNTFDFDESLVYTGKGAKKNNYLINDFLKSEKEEKQVFKLCQLPPEDFQTQIDSIKAIKIKNLDLYKEKHNTSALFNKIAKANIVYDYYTSKEVYPFVHYGRNKKKIIEALPDDFYSYRETINYNDEFFKDYFNYTSFLKRSFNNIALEKHIQHTKSPYNIWMNCCYNLDKMAAIDSLVHNAEIKNELLFHYGMKFLSKNKKMEDNDRVIKYILSKSTDKKNNDRLITYNQSINKLKPGEFLPNLQVRNIQNDIVFINDLINKPTVVYFWSHLYKGFFEDSHKRVNELTSKYPEVEFISVNIDDYSKDRWITTIKSKKHILLNEYIFETPDESVKKLAIYPLNKAILVNHNRKIVNGHANMFANGFEEELLGLLNR
ncbi:TlpA family protein disulfide reductase [Hyunsoonleella sp. 2307UL5-6]|uniref:TlpA family protein disulfide reductase n=1 Tax=Hyunsoonleella sp. 2307UL5-6 TaxID=3384768 RepID=UPI0039BC75BC